MEKAKTVLQYLHYLDPTIVLYPYYTKDNQCTSLFKGQFLTSPLMIVKYFANYFVKPEEAMKVWSRILMGHEHKFEKIKSTSAPIFNNYDGGLFKRALQCESVFCIGWILFSGRFTNLEDLQNLLNRILDIEIVLRYRRILLHDTQNFQCQAVHIDSDKEVAKETREKIRG